MKQLNIFINEKLKIDKNIKIDNKEINIKFDKSKIEDFPKDDIDKIIEFAESLQIKPDEIEYFPNSNAIRLGYRYNNDKSKLQYGIIFGCINNIYVQKGYRIEYMEDYNDRYEEYPKFPKVISLEECFDYIDKKFNDWIK